MIREFVTETIGIQPGISAERLYDKYKTAESGILETEGMPLHYRVTGSGRPLMLLHGVASSLHTWSEWHRILSPHFTVISLDLPGFGLTGPHPAADYSVAMYMRTLDALADHLKLGKFSLAGNSFGGFLTWNYALHATARLDRIILSDAAGFNTSRSELSDFGFILASSPYTSKISHILTPKSLVAASLRNAVADSSVITADMLDRYYDLLMRKGNRQAFTKILNGLILTGADNSPRIKEVSIPTLITWGNKDNLINPEDALKFHRAIKGSRLIIYPDTGHLPMEERPEESASDVLKFLNDKISIHEK